MLQDWEKCSTNREKREYYVCDVLEWCVKSWMIGKCTVHGIAL